MNDKKLFRLTLGIQGSYILLTALWALLDIDSFMTVTGPKTDIWLVKTVSVLLIPIAVCFLSNLYFTQHPLPVILLALTTSIGLSCIDFYYTSNHTIKWVYALDGFVEVFFALVWSYLLIRYRRLL